MDAAIETKGLIKHYGTTVALDGVDLTVNPGEIHGFLGPNGSGKSRGPFTGAGPPRRGRDRA